MGGAARGKASRSQAAGGAGAGEEPRTCPRLQQTPPPAAGRTQPEQARPLVCEPRLGPRPASDLPRVRVSTPDARKHSRTACALPGLGARRPHGAPTGRSVSTAPEPGPPSARWARQESGSFPLNRRRTWGLRLPEGQARGQRTAQAGPVLSSVSLPLNPSLVQAGFSRNFSLWRPVQ